MKCPYCSHENTRVIDSRPAEDNNSIRRRRVCDECGKRFTTYEKIETIPLIVIKKDENREPYDRSKIEAGVLRACHKRPISINQINQLVDEVETEIFNREEKEIPSRVIGELVMDKLKNLEAVAYVRFASVYRELKDINTFMDELKKLAKPYAEDEDDTLRDTIARAKHDRDRASEALLAAQQRAGQDTEKEDALGTLRTVGAQWDSLDAREKQSLVRACVDRIVLRNDRIEIFYAIEGAERSEVRAG